VLNHLRKAHLLPYAMLLFSSVSSAQDTEGRFHFDVPAPWLRAEQVLSATTPVGSNVRNLISRLVPFTSHNGALPKEFIPQNEPQFELITLLIPEGEMSINRALHVKTSIPYEVVIGGKKLDRFFIHPSQRKLYADLIAKYPADSTRWLATPSSSARTVFVQDSRHEFSPFIGKLSLALAMGGVKTRVLGPVERAHAVVMDDLYQEIRSQYGGVLKQSGKMWDFMHESVAMAPKAHLEAGLVFRELPDLGDDILIPWYALVSKDGKDRWIDRLFAASGETDKVEFVWKHLVLPLDEFYSLTSLENAIKSELHQQNTLIRVSKNLKVIGLVGRDGDALRVDRLIREKVLKKTALVLSETASQGVYNINGTHFRNVIDAYGEHVRFHNIESILKYFLSAQELSDVLVKSDQFVMGQFNHFYPEAKVITPAEMPGRWQEMRIRANGGINPDLNARIPLWARKYRSWLRDKLNYRENAGDKVGYCGFFFR
jgi:hypothetical protein